MKQYSRLDKLNRLVQTVLGEIIEGAYPYERYGMITITEVELSRDLRHAKIYISVFLDKEHTVKEEEVISVLEKDEYKIKKELVSQVRMKYTPKLHFIPDHTQEKADEIYRLLEKESHGHQGE
ncbi:MAG TPA: 30S ribosome-binding factor RbfA [Candidatus Mcinerneyibacteriales bacterium]|nr:30S ribosome-binding factor RbfA [Candidatus Mcinerneyibacteriales bacterium]